jgi:hypothetical protein
VDTPCEHRSFYVQTDELPQEGPVHPLNDAAEKQTKSAKEAADSKQGPAADPTSTSSPTPEQNDAPPSGPVQLPRGPFEVTKEGLHSRPSDVGFEFPTVGQDGSYGDRAPEQENLGQGFRESLGQGLGQGFRESLGQGLREGLGQGLEAADLMVGDPDEDSAWRELLQIVTGYCADSCGGNKIRFTHEDSGKILRIDCWDSTESEGIVEVIRRSHARCTEGTLFGFQAVP